jgi:hypothetical protein
MLHHRYLWAVLISSFSIIALAMALTHVIYPITALTQTTGTVVALHPAPEAHLNTQLRLIDVRFVTQREEAIVVTDRINASYSARLGDPLPISYFPWAPQEGRIGAISQSIVLAIAFQWALIAICGMFGIAGCIAGIRLLSLAHHHQLYLLGLYCGIVVLLVTFAVLPRPVPMT